MQYICSSFQRLTETTQHPKQCQPAAAVLRLKSSVTDCATEASLDSSSLLPPERSSLQTRMKLANEYHINSTET